MKFSIYLNRRVLVMSLRKEKTQINTYSYTSEPEFDFSGVNDTASAIFPLPARFFFHDAAKFDL